jgi:hypothetical protein
VADDVFVLRRVAPGRFVHLGGKGRGEGWAGIVEANVEEDAAVAEALRSDKPVRPRTVTRVCVRPVLRAGGGVRAGDERRGRRSVRRTSSGRQTMRWQPQRPQQPTVESATPANPADELEEPVRAAIAVNDTGVESTMLRSLIAAESLSRGGCCPPRRR